MQGVSDWIICVLLCASCVEVNYEYFGDELPNEKLKNEQKEVGNTVGAPAMFRPQVPD